MGDTDYLGSLTQRVEELMDKHIERTERAPQQLILPESTYVVLEDYCIAKEQEIHMQLLMLKAQITEEARHDIERKIQIAKGRLAQLRQHGVKLFTCKYGQIPIEVQSDIWEITIE